MPRGQKVTTTSVTPKGFEVVVKNQQGYRQSFKVGEKFQLFNVNVEVVAVKPEGVELKFA